MRDYARRESAAVALIDELLIGAGKSIDDLVAEDSGGPSIMSSGSST